MYARDAPSLYALHAQLARIIPTLSAKMIGLVELEELLLKMGLFAKGADAIILLNEECGICSAESASPLEALSSNGDYKCHCQGRS